MARVDLTAPYLDSARDMMIDRVTRVIEHPYVSVMLESELEKLEGFVGNFKATISCTAPRARARRIEVVDVGSVIVCTGYKEFDASRVTHFGYGKLPNVITSFEFEQMLKQGRIELKDGRLPQYVAIIHCVGSRSEEFHGYCSRVCCMTALKYAHEVKSALPRAYVSDVYVDMHAFGEGLRGLLPSQRGGQDALPDVRQGRPAGGAQGRPGDDCEMLITVDERLSGRADRAAGRPHHPHGRHGEHARTAAAVTRLVNISQDKDGLVHREPPKLDPVATTTDGVYIAGACQAPKDIPDWSPRRERRRPGSWAR